MKSEQRKKLGSWLGNRRLAVAVAVRSIGLEITAFKGAADDSLV